MSEVSEDGKGELGMEYISVHCRDCCCDFDLEIDEHGCALGVCGCEEIPEDLGLEDTICLVCGFASGSNKLCAGCDISDYLLEKNRSQSK